ncbi:flagellar basal body P-ring formation chaperone FlgA [Helicobacter sp. MIT 14-3879]|uniref:flagellar basal body P-ring formation chaperone FlgA n=1 Tax=Helicobacter sp. MIT 14-3879 TaxID=2040649 RepID=UPI000E1F1834|nr:flagellar basal body P-ring formation chaperone FlgA [Helicobacter sp. MIT 14-3879]RDU62875.1 flagella basal body P-ring formation protein FlgA [Helicobacter sp. MIT 14-3879]
MKKIILLFLFVFTFGEDATSLNSITTEVKKLVENKFLKYYKNYNIQINYLEVSPVMDNNLDKYSIDKVIFDDRDLRKDSGNFEVYLYHNEKKKKVFFNFSINAIIDSLTATNSIKSGEVINSNNTTISQIPITRNMILPVSKDILDKYSAKSFISSGSSIISSKITPKIIVSKGDIVEVTYNIGNINILFNAKALEDGSMGQSIKAQNTQSGKNINIIILGPKNAKINQ